MCVLLKNSMLAVQSIKLTSTDFWSTDLLQMGAEIRQSVADVDTDSLLSQNWPPSMSVRHGKPILPHGKIRTEKTGKK